MQRLLPFIFVLLMAACSGVSSTDHFAASTSSAAQSQVERLRGVEASRRETQAADQATQAAAAWLTSIAPRPTETPQPTATPTATMTPTPTPQPTATTTSTATPEPTATATMTARATEGGIAGEAMKADTDSDAASRFIPIIVAAVAFVGLLVLLFVFWIPFLVKLWIRISRR